MATKTKHSPSNTTILYRSETNKVLGGVCGGLAEVFNFDANLIRILFVIAFLFGGSGLLFYIILWVIIPSRSKLSNTSDENIRENLDEMKERAHAFTKEFQGNNQRSTVGVVLLVLGILFLLNNFGFVPMYNLHRFWPVALVIVGVIFLSRKPRP